MSLLPAVFVGIGPFALRVLNETANQLRQSYPLDERTRVSLVALDVTAKAAIFPEPEVEFYSLWEKMDAWSSARESLPPALAGWFSGGVARLAQWDRSRGRLDRQIARAVFLRHWEAHRRSLEDYLDARLNVHVAQTERAGDMTVYLLGSLADPAMSGVFLDVANLIRYCSQKSARIVLYLALPTAHRTIKDSDRDKLGEVLVALRELERFGIRSEAWQHAAALYPADSLLSEFNQARWLFDSIHLFSEPVTQGDREAALAEAWALSFLTAADGSFGKSLIDFELTNRDDALQAAAARNPGELLIGTRMARAAVLPIDELTQTWANKLADEALTHWLKPVPSQEAIQAAWTTWAVAQTGFEDPTDARSVRQKVHAPQLLFNLASVGGASLSAVSELRYETLRSWICGTDDPLDTPTRRKAHTYEALTTWLPTVADADQLKDRHAGAGFSQQVQDQVLRAVGSSEGLDEGVLMRAFQDCAASQRDHFERSLLAFTCYAIVELAPEGTLKLLALVSDRLTQAAQQLRNALPTIERNESQLRASYTEAGKSLDTLFTGFPHRPTSQLQTFLTRAGAYIDHLRVRMALSTLASLAQSFHALVEQRIAELEPWGVVLWRGEGSLLERVRQEARKSPAPRPAWLLNRVWADNLYDERFAGRARLLSRELSWQAVVMRDGQVRIKPFLGGVAFLDESQGAYSDVNYGRWLEYVRKDERWREVRETLTLWDYLLSTYGTTDREKTVPTVLQMPPLATEYYGQRASAIDHNLLFPAAPLNLPVSDFYSARLAERVVGIENRTLQQHTLDAHGHLIYLVSADLLPLSAIPVLEQSRRAYERTLRDRRDRFYVIDGEAQAHLLEKQAGLQKFLSPPLVAALAQPTRARLFLWLDAIGIVGTIPGSQGLLWYALGIPGDKRTYPLNQFGEVEDAALLWMDALLNFCLMRVSLPDSGSLQQIVDAWVADFADDYLAQNLPGEHWIQARQLINTSVGVWAVRSACEIETLRHYQQFSAQEAQRVFRQREVWEMMGALADVMANEKCDELSQAVHRSL